MKFAELDFNEEFVAAFASLENTGEHIFITGKAGTGKSTLLQYFCQKTAKNVALLAPTGVAAINIKGQTIHSFFGFKPDVTPESVVDIPVRKRRRKMYQELEAVIIDEVSMVRADLLDCVDIFLRLYGPHYDRPFGGVQMIFFGDLFQLPPVVGRGEEDIFKTHYATPFFFSAKVFEALDLKIMQLKKIYRQKDEHFIRLLNAVRDDNLEDHHWETLNRRFKPNELLVPEDFYIVLTTTNALAEKVNNQRLQNLSGMSKLYPGAISGEFDRKSLPSPEVLELKSGAQVMMLNNDPEKRWVNGSLGKVMVVISNDEGEDVIKVELANGEVVDVKKHTWEIYQYYFDDVANALASKIIGYFNQYPLKLAWAVTIHKSQGQTFEKVIIDVGWGTFTHGQMYVALSRCTTLEGIILKQPLLQRHILMDERVLQFMKTRAISLVLFILFLLFSFSGWAQTPELDRSHAVEQALSNVESKQVNPKSWEEGHADQPYIGLLTETDTILHDDWSFDEDYHARVKIQKEAAKSLGQWPIYYNKSREEIIDIKAFVETPEGKKFEATDIKDLQAFDQSPLYADMRLKVITFPKINIGSVIDVRVKTRVKQEEIPGQFWDEVTYPSIPTKYALSTFVFPANKPVLFHAYRNTTQPVIEKNNGTVKYSFIFEETDYREDEDFMPPSDWTIGVLSLSSMSDWKQVADWYRSLIDKNTVDDPAITSRVMELVGPKTNLKDKVRAILEFIQDNFRYVKMSLGDHTVELHPTDAVFHDRYGDCKDLSLLARQMLKIIGVDANICLFSGELNGDPQHSLPNPSAFDHIVLQITVDGQKYFVDTQTKGFDLGQLPSSYDNAHVLVIEPQGYHFDHLPVADESFHSVISSSNVMLYEDGSADYEVHVQMPVEASQDFKSSWHSTDDNNKQKFFDNLQATFAQGGKITDRNVKGLENRYGPVEFDFKYSAANAYSVVNDMVLVRETEQGDVPDFSEEKRRYPIFVPTNSLIRNHNMYHIPEGLKLEFVPSDYDLEMNFMQVSTKYTRGDNTVTQESTYRLKRATIPTHAYPQVKKLRDELNKKNQEYIVLRKKSNLAPEAKTWLRAQ
jgi:ATP-dependent DNA helicase PIF1